MAPMELVWRESFRVRFYDAEPGGRAAVPALCRYLMEAADSHCRPLGMTLSGLRESGRMWVLARLALRIDELPSRDQEVTVETWGSNRIGAVRAYRDFRIFDAAGGVLAEASSLWLVLDMQTRKPVRLPEEILLYRHPEWRTPEAVDAIQLEPPEQLSREERLKVLWRDLDANGHANAVSHIEWALDAVPVELRRSARLASLDIQFLGEAFLGEDLVSQAEVATGGVVRHRIITGEGRMLDLARTVWRG
jgi:medium-chain acyl-[acyl-carrier-protein] hydrolase